MTDDLSIFTSIVKPLTDTSRPGYFSSSFSPEAGFYVLGYSGPSVPYQKVIKTDDASQSSQTSALASRVASADVLIDRLLSRLTFAEFDYVLESNDALNETLSRFILPTSNQVVVESDGYQLNVKEIRPPNMDETGKTKYPVVSLIDPSHVDGSLRYSIADQPLATSIASHSSSFSHLVRRTL